MSEKRVAMVHRRAKHQREVKATKNAKGANIGTGNRCGHDPKHLRTYQRNPEYKDEKPVFQQVKERINDLAGRPKACPAVFYRHAENPDERRQERSEGRERDAAYLCTCIDHANLITLRVGVPQEGGGFYRYSVEELAKGTCLELDEDRGPGRFHRAAMEMHRKGFIDTKHRSGKKGHGPDNLRSSRVVTQAFLKAIGMAQVVQNARLQEGQRNQNGGLTDQELGEKRQQDLRPTVVPLATPPRTRPSLLAAYLQRSRDPPPT